MGQRLRAWIRHIGGLGLITKTQIARRTTARMASDVVGCLTLCEVHSDCDLFLCTDRKGDGVGNDKCAVGDTETCIAT